MIYPLVKGNVPDGKFYDDWYPDFRWGPTTILSNAIGQGEILVTLFNWQT